jgi:hypothetical protein
MSRLPAVSAMLVVALSGCAKEVPIVEVSGDCADVNGGQVCTMARTRGDSVIDVGAVVPLTSIANAPVDAEMAWPPMSAAILSLPAAVQQQSGLQEFTMYWEAHGHPPAPYMTPHFDFHFYTVSDAERMAIDCTDTAKPSELAAGYSLPDQDLPPEMAQMIGVSTLVGICVPQMGMHSLLTSELESTTPFRGSMVLGYYATRPIFIEPMITQAMLMEEKSFTLPIPSIPGATGNYPRSFRADYDSTAKAYHLVFSDFAPGS